MMHDDDECSRHSGVVLGFEYCFSSEQWRSQDCKTDVITTILIEIFKFDSCVLNTKLVFPTSDDNFT